MITIDLIKAVVPVLDDVELEAAKVAVREEARSRGWAKYNEYYPLIMEREGLSQLAAKRVAERLSKAPLTYSYEEAMAAMKEGLLDHRWGGGKRGKELDAWEESWTS